MSKTSGYPSNILVETGTNELEIITFYLQFREEDSGNFTKAFYGINAAKVMELVALPDEITAIANSPDYVEGIFLLRDRTITLVDLCSWFNYEPDTGENSRKTWTVIVAELNGMPYGFITHGVDKVYRVSWEQISVPPELVARGKSLTGICLMNDQIIQMVDFERIIAMINPELNDENDSEETNEDNSPAGDLQEKTVVVAEDSPTIKERLRKVLTNAGYKPVINGDGQEAWDYLESISGNSDVLKNVLAIVSDIEMPRMDGHHLCLKLKEHPVLRKIPVILCSSMINDALRKKGETVGADCQITKPEISDLPKHIETVIGKTSE